MQPISTSALGSVNGKKLGLNLTGVSGLNMLWINNSSTPFEVAEGDIVINHESFNLVEHGSMGNIRIAAVDLSGRNYLSTGASFVP